MTWAVDPDDEALIPRRINRNMRIREAQVQVLEVLAAFGRTARAQYPEGTSVKWLAKPGRPVKWGLALAGDDLIGPYVRVIENHTNRVHVIEIEKILDAGDLD